jgi:hypothetical protein
MGIRDQWQGRKGLFRKSAMIGTPPSKRRLWEDPAEHAQDFSRRYAHDIDLVVAERMRELGFHPDQIGMPDAEHGINWAAFHPHATIGGGCRRGIRPGADA